MKLHTAKILVFGLLVTAGSAHAALTTNSWNDGSSKWELGANWSAGVPSPANAINYVTGGGIPIGPRTITIDVATVNSNVGNNCLTISNLVIGGTLIAPDTLFLNNANNTPGNIGLTILNTMTLSSHGFLSITNSRLALDTALYNDSFITLNTGSVTCTNTLAVIGNNGGGTLNVQDGAWTATGVTFTYLGLNPGASGTLNLSGGTASFSFGGLILGNDANTVGTIWMTGGLLNTGYEIVIGNEGIGQMTVSNGTWQSGPVTVGSFGGGQGTLTLAGGNNVFSQYLALGQYDAVSTGAVWMTGGQLTIPSNVTYVGEHGTGQMTVSNGVWSANSVTAGGFAGSVGTLTVAGGTTTLSSDLNVGMNPGSTGAVWMTGGQFTVTNGVTLVSSNGVGQMTISNGTWSALYTFVGFNPGSDGTLTVAGGTNLISFILDVGLRTNATGAVWMSSGQLLVTNAGIGVALGDSGVGQMTISNGTVQTPSLVLGYTSTSQGTLTVADGTVTVGAGGTTLGNGPTTTGTVWMTGGQLIGTSGQTILGGEGVARFTISNGTWQAGSVVVADFDDSVGTLTAAGGTATMTNLVLGDCDVNALGYLLVRGGNVYITNATHTATLDVRDGWVVFTGGQLVVDRLVMTNACGLFLHSGGILSVGSMVLDPNLDADGDGLPNGWEQQYGLDPLSSIGDDGADGDPDGDGIPNWQEYLDGTNPVLGPRTFRILSLTPIGNTMEITWTTLAGTTNAVQAAPGAADGSYSTNGFVDISSPSVTIGSGAVTNSYFDVGAATNFPARYYRVRLVP